MDQMVYNFRLRRSDRGFAPQVSSEQGSRRSHDRKSPPATPFGNLLRSEDWQSVWEAVASDTEGPAQSSLALTEFHTIAQERPARCNFPAW